MSGDLDLRSLELKTGASVNELNLGLGNVHTIFTPFFCTFFLRRKAERQTDGQSPYCSLLGQPQREAQLSLR